MSNVKTKILIIGLIGINIALMVVLGIYFLGQDSTKPKIEFSAAEVVYYDGITTEELREGVVAKDNEDGDISDRIVVEKVTMNEEKNAAVVYFAVSDTSGNVAKASKMFPLDPNADLDTLTASSSDVKEEETKPEPSPIKTPVASPSPEATPSSEVSPSPMADAEDAQDEGTVVETERTSPEPSPLPSPSPKASPSPKPSPSPKASPSPSPKPSPSPSPSPKASPSPTPSPSPAANQDEGTVVETERTSPVITVKGQEFTIKVGGTLSPKDVIASATDDVDSASELIKHASITSVPNDVPGTYTAYVSTTDKDGNVATAIPIVIKVEE